MGLLDFFNEKPSKKPLMSSTSNELDDWLKASDLTTTVTTTSTGTYQNPYVGQQTFPAISPALAGTAGTGGWGVGIGGGAGGGGVSGIQYQNQTQFITLPSPFGVNQQTPSNLLITLIIVPNFEAVEKDARVQPGDIVLCMDSKKMFTYRVHNDPSVARVQSEWVEVRINPDMSISLVQQVVKVKEERKEIYDEFEKHLTEVERSKDDRNLLQKAKDFLTGSADAAYLPASQP